MYMYVLLSGDYCHMAYNVITAFCLLKLLEQSQRPVPKYIQVLKLALDLLEIARVKVP